MRIGRLRILASIVAILMACLFLMVIQQIFTPFEYAYFPIDTTLISVEDVGSSISSLLWTNRQLDLIALAILLFTTATCCTTILRFDKGEQD